MDNEETLKTIGRGTLYGGQKVCTPLVPQSLLRQEAAKRKFPQYPQEMKDLAELGQDSNPV